MAKYSSSEHDYVLKNVANIYVTAIRVCLIKQMDFWQKANKCETAELQTFNIFAVLAM